MSIARREAAVIGAYTGVLIGPFSDLHKYIEEILERPVFTHELGFEEMREKIKEASRADFMEIAAILAEKEAS